ncbi:MAG TPA: TIGR02453 family protein [Lachnospiraceae bacterium]|nr:TIGR02453 family protein [Lachnospiraceae bacterium]
MSERWFTEEAASFLCELKERNSRQWYLDNKEVYQEVVMKPLIDLVCSLSSTMLDIDNDMEVRPFVGKTISRIHCDARFSKNVLFKDRMWVTFKKIGASKVDYPSFFFEFSPYSYRYGMGFFSASPKSMLAIREAIDENEKDFIKIIKKVKKDNLFSPEGEMYKKEYYKGKNAEVALWYNRRNIYLVRNSNDITELYSMEKIDEIRKGFENLKDMYQFFASAIGRES